jgi:hypothetical protein
MKADVWFCDAIVGKKAYEAVVGVLVAVKVVCCMKYQMRKET